MADIQDLYAKGYAVPLYGLQKHTWQHFNEHRTLPHGAVPVEDVEGMPCAKWTDVLKAADGRA